MQPKDIKFILRNCVHILQGVMLSGGQGQHMAQTGVVNIMNTVIDQIEEKKP